MEKIDKTNSKKKETNFTDSKQLVHCYNCNLNSLTDTGVCWYCHKTDVEVIRK